MALLGITNIPTVGAAVAIRIAVCGTLIINNKLLHGLMIQASYDKTQGLPSVS